LIKENQHITVFEHETIRFDKGTKRITEDQFMALQNYYGEGVPYFNLVYNGVRFNEYVGVIQIGKTLIEVLPKADKNTESTFEQNKWRDVLIGMLKLVGDFDIQNTSSSHLKIKPNTILDLYFEFFIEEVEYLLHNGLVKQYRKKEGNVIALKGSLQFGKHIQNNLTNQERFYVRHSTYDTEHKLHFILYKTIKLLKQINTNAALLSRIGALLLHFPEMPDLKVSEATFTSIVYNRKTQSYKQSIEIAKLILLQYHPDISKGRNDLLALMFDMNKLWEKYIYKMLKRANVDGYKIGFQNSQKFWNTKTIRPDLVVSKYEQGELKTYVIDTKWKVIDNRYPSDDDLKQMFAYNLYWDAGRSMLLYPKVLDYEESYGVYHKGREKGNTCKLGFVDVLDSTGKLDLNIGKVILNKLEED